MLFIAEDINGDIPDLSIRDIPVLKDYRLLQQVCRRSNYLQQVCPLSILIARVLILVDEGGNYRCRDFRLKLRP